MSKSGDRIKLIRKRCDKAWIRRMSLDNDIGKSKAPPPILASLEESLGSNSKSDLTSLQKLRLHSVKKDLLFLNDQGFPLPVQLTQQQWDRLMGLIERGHRNEYLDVIKNGEDEERKYRELKEADEEAQKGLEFTEETFRHVMKEEYFTSQSLEERLQMINHVYQEMRDAGEVLPLVIVEKGLRELITLSNTRQIEQFFAAKGLIRTRKEHDFVKKRAKRALDNEGRKKFNEERHKEKHLVYGIGRNSIMLRHYPRDMDRSLGWYAVREFHKWGQPLVIDLSFMSQMSFRAAKSMAYREITYSLVENRTSSSPFAIHFTNYNEDCEKTRLIFDFHPNLRDDPSYPAALSAKCHTELFDKDRLVYLSPNSDNELKEYDSDDIYVIGALNDSGHQTPFTLAQARKDGIRHAKLPLRKYIG